MTYTEKVLIWKKMDNSINRKGTGNPDEFAEYLGIGRRTVFKFLKHLRRWGASIGYNKFRKSYYYENDKRPVLPNIPIENFDDLDD